MAVNDFLPSALQLLVQGSPWAQALRASESGSMTGQNTFTYDSQGSPLKSTQQLNVDWSRFENHTFFMPAYIKVNQAFDQIINRFPFDGTQKEVEEFLDSLTGFEKWVFDNFPRYRGALHFNNSYISVIDSAGSLFPAISKKADSKSSVKGAPCVELQLFLPAESNENSVIYQKSAAADKGISLVLSASTSAVSASCYFVVVSGSAVMSASATLQKGAYNHICSYVDTQSGLSTANIFLKETLVATSAQNRIDDLGINASNLLIGSGTTISATSPGNFSFVPKTTLSGTMEEFRVFSYPRSVELQNKFASRQLFASSDLSLYFRFNEPPPPLTDDPYDLINAIVLDSSGNSLHSTVHGFVDSLRVNAATDPLNPMTLERSYLSPVLFPGYPDVVSYNENLLLSASAYDKENPNIITRLVPPHYLLEGAAQDGYGKDVENEGMQPYGGAGGPGSGVLSPQQLMLSFLYIWSKYFDELKLYVDQFSSLDYVDYESQDSIPDTFLLNKLRREGYNFPSFFVDSNIQQYLNGEDTDRDYSVIESSLKKIQNELTRRVLVSMPSIMSSKGTLSSVRQFLSAVGIDPDNTVKLREYGGPSSRSLNYARDNHKDVSLMLDFSSGGYLTSSYLVADRVEPGFPQKSNTQNDTLLTSGSWTVEGFFKLPTTVTSPQSIMRMMSTGSVGGSIYPFCMCNVVSTPQAGMSSSLTLYVNDSDKFSPATQTLSIELPLSASGIYDGNKWYVSFGKKRNDAIGQVSSSYFLRAGVADSAGIVQSYEATGSFREDGNYFEKYDVNLNASGSFIAIGTGNVYPYIFMTSSIQNTSTFSGRASNVRFWSKALTPTEWKEHVRNYRSTGVDLPNLNYNYVNKLTGSFEKLRLDIINKHDSYLLSGATTPLSFVDYSQNGFGATGYNFLPGTGSFKAEIFESNALSTRYDESSTTEKVRVRSLNIDNAAFAPWTQLPPVYASTDVDMNTPTDDTRFSVDFSLVDSLNRDMSNIFSSYDVLNNAIGNPNLAFGESYPDLERIQDVYFNRLSGPIDFKTFFEFYKWFDKSIGSFIEQLLPKRTNFKGVNYVVEPHMIERTKVPYFYSENYALYRKNSVAGSSRNVSWLVESPIKKY